MLFACNNSLTAIYNFFPGVLAISSAHSERATPSYLPPEQCLHDIADVRRDLHCVEWKLDAVFHYGAGSQNASQAHN